MIGSWRCALPRAARAAVLPGNGMGTGRGNSIAERRGAIGQRLHRIQIRKMSNMKTCATCKFWLRDDAAKVAGGKRAAVGLCLLAAEGADKTRHDFSCLEWHAKS